MESPTPVLGIKMAIDDHATRIIRVRVPDSQGPFSVGQFLLRRGDSTATVYRIYDSNDGETLVDLILDPPGALVSDLVPAG